jgi:SAM-dependent methyltransferase
MPITPDFRERVLLSLNQAPGPLLDLLGAAAFRAAGVAAELGVFEHLERAPLSAAALAKTLSIDGEATRRLLDFLVAASYLSRSGDTYANSPMVSRWLVPGRADGIADFFGIWQGVLRELWGELDGSIRRGAPETHLHEWLSRDPRRWASFNTAMEALARRPAKELARRVPVPHGAASLLDVGGNHGLYSVAFCRRHPRLHATIFDVPEALPRAHRHVAQLGDRITLRAGDILVDDPGAGYDVALISNVIHYFDEAQAGAAIETVARALAPNGLLVVSDQLAGRAPTRALGAFERMLSLNYLTVLGGDVYPLERVTAWLGAAGFATPRRLRLRTVQGQTVLLARKERR